MKNYASNRRKEKIDSLRNALEIRKNTLKMMEKTYDEMLKKGTSKDTLSKVRGIIDESNSEIENIQNDLNCLKYKEMLYGKGSSFFDRIGKCDAIKESTPITYHRETPFKTECRDIGNGIGCFETSILEDDGVNKKITNELIHEAKTVPFDDDLAYSEGEVLKSCLFTASFLSGMKIQPWRIKDVSFHDSYGTVSITMLDCIMNVNGMRVPLIKVLKNLMDNEVTMIFSVKHMDGNGTIKYEEQFYGCKIKDFSRGGLSTDRNVNTKNESRIYVSLSYGGIRYIVN